MEFIKTILKYSAVKVLIFTGLLVLSWCGGYFYRKYSYVPQDNAIEQSIELIIKNYTGYDVDLSPDSPEDNSKNKIYFNRKDKS